eukprot:Rhum_TRINITY_DN4068_c0_g1::Rhum_TRINITY_DN4068_c0_g1_i1::g.12840::m.12840
MGSRFTEKIPEIVRFFFSGVLGTLLDYAAYKAIYDSHIFPFFRPTLSWALAYALSVVWQHSLHAFFVFGGYGGMGYWRSLGAMYVAYSGSILTSPVINYALIEYAKVDHGVAFLATLLITGLGNYLLLTKSMGSGHNATEAIILLSGGIPVDAMRPVTDKRTGQLPGGARSAGSTHHSTVVIGSPSKSSCVVS